MSALTDAQAALATVRLAESQLVALVKTLSTPAPTPAVHQGLPLLMGSF